jgi:DNA-directed RNA polymerase sigma subunit (sigma70/sigma32)
MIPVGVRLINGFEAIKLLREMVQIEEGRRILESYLAQLNPRQKTVLELRIGLTDAGCLTLKQVAQHFGISSIEMIRRNEWQACRTIRTLSNYTLLTEKEDYRNVRPLWPRDQEKL